MKPCQIQAHQTDSQIENSRITYAFWLAIIGLTLAAILVIFLLLSGAFKAATDIVAIGGLFTSVLGTLVGAFFGLQIGSAGKEKAQQNEVLAVHLDANDPRQGSMFPIQSKDSRSNGSGAGPSLNSRSPGVATSASGEGLARR